MFYRSNPSTDYFMTYFTYRKKINKYNIDKLSGYKINKILEDVEPQSRFTFLHNVLWSYNRKFYKEDYIYLDKLKKIIKSNNIILNTKEVQYLYLLEERIFTRLRTLKILDTFHPFNKGEKLYAKYKDGKVYFQDKFYYRNIIHGEILLTNKRMLVKTLNKFSDYEFHYDQMKNFQYKIYGFEFDYGKEKVLIRAHDQLTLCNMMRRFEKNKWLIK